MPHTVESAAKELPEETSLFDLSEHRFNDLLAQPIARAMSGKDVAELLDHVASSFGLARAYAAFKIAPLAIPLCKTRLRRPAGSLPKLYALNTSILRLI